MRNPRAALSFRQIVWVVFTACLLTAFAGSAYAAKYAGIVVDAKTGKTLYQSSPDSLRYPASLTKMMTLYILFQELDAGHLRLDSKLKVSRYAASRPPTKLGLRPGSTIDVKDAILGLVTQSANDDAVVIAENIEGSESKFAARMTRTAHSLGMTRTVFRNANGLPNSAQHTTARDMAKLGIALQERFPEYFKFFNTQHFVYKGRRYHNHNHLVGKVRGVNGIKTGFINAAGYNLVTSVNRDNRKIVAVVMGGRTWRSRDLQMIKLIDEYMPKASTSPKRAPLVATRGIQPPFRAAKLKDVPTPDLKPGTQVAVAAPTKHANSIGSLIETAAAQTPSPAAEEAVASSSADREAADTPVPRFASTFNAFDDDAAPIPSAAPAEAKAAVSDTNVDTRKRDDKPVVVASASEDLPTQKPSWQIQITASDSEKAAQTMLDKARSAASHALRQSTPTTETVETNGQTFYRARFVGFSTQTAALRACKTLKRAKFACYAVYQ